jgi:pimeloyl-ACP methyl ester carboxylesterase
VIFTSLYFTQERIIFIEQKLAPEARERVIRGYPEAEEVRLDAPDGVRLHGWLVRGEGGDRRPLLVYFGGNAEEVSTSLAEAATYAEKGWSVLLMNYRGYGLSQGSPGEKELFRDAEFIYDYLAGQGVGCVALMGRSLGTGVAVYLASVRPVIGVVLVSPFDSLREVAREHYPFLPISLLLKHPFDSLSRAGSIDAPLLALVAEKDEVISPALSLRLVEHWGGPRTIRVVEGAGHNSISASPVYRQAVEDFLEGLTGPDGDAPQESL